MYQGVIIAGFGGQGVVSMGILLAYSGMVDGKHVTFFPAYGAEMRGGTANCTVVVSSEEVASPVVSKLDTLVVMNEPSLLKFETQVKPGGRLLINSSLVNAKPKRTDIEITYIPANEIAEEVGSTKIANMVMMGAYAKLTGAVPIATIKESIPKVYTRAKKEIVEMNYQAVDRGAEAVKK